jgi:hypothetical protein
MMRAQQSMKRTGSNESFAEVPESSRERPRNAKLFSFLSRSGSIYREMTVLRWTGFGYLASFKVQSEGSTFCVFCLSFHEDIQGQASGGVTT